MARRSLARQFDDYVEPDPRAGHPGDNSTRSGHRAQPNNNMANWRLARQRRVQGGQPRNVRQSNRG